jgi:hypothetical protein
MASVRVVTATIVPAVVVTAVIVPVMFSCGH